MAFILRRMAQGRTRVAIRSLIKEGRLVFLNAEQVRYTDKEGKKKDLSLDGMVKVILDKSGLSKDSGFGAPITYLGVDYSFFRKIIVDEYNRRKK